MSDIISRADAINAFERGEEYHSDTIADILSDIPSADRPSGEWQYEKMVMPLSNHTKECYRCSVCHTHWDCETYFCPNCGARMENNK